MADTMSVRYILGSRFKGPFLRGAFPDLVGWVSSASGHPFAALIKVHDSVFICGAVGECQPPR